METKNITNNKQYWETVKGFLENTNSNSRNKITLIKRDEIISSSKDVAETFNRFFVNIDSNLDTFFDESLLDKSKAANDPIAKII